MALVIFWVFLIESIRRTISRNAGTYFLFLFGAGLDGTSGEAGLAGSSGGSGLTGTSGVGSAGASGGGWGGISGGGWDGISGGGWDGTSVFDAPFAGESAIASRIWLS